MLLPPGIKNEGNICFASCVLYYFYIKRIFADYSYYTKAYSGVTSFNILKDEVEIPVHLLKLMAGEI